MLDANQAQRDYWSSPAGLKWIENEQALDTAMAGMLELVVDEACLEEDDIVLDIGCGTGASTIEAAKRVRHGSVVGADIASPLIERARMRARAERLTNVEFLLADAQVHSFPHNDFNVLISRLGMMFFEDPVAAFKNLSQAIRTDGRMAFAAWAGVEQNPWFQIPRDAAIARLGAASQADPTAPGPLAFQDIARVSEMMRTAGLCNAQATPIGVVLTPPGGIDAAARTASRVGPAARIIKTKGGSEDDAKAIETVVAHKFRTYCKGNDVEVPAVVNLFTATCP